MSFIWQIIQYKQMPRTTGPYVATSLVHYVTPTFIRLPNTLASHLAMLWQCIIQQCTIYLLLCNNSLWCYRITIATYQIPSEAFCNLQYLTLLCLDTKIHLKGRDRINVMSELSIINTSKLCGLWWKNRSYGLVELYENIENLDFFLCISDSYLRLRP